MDDAAEEAGDTDGVYVVLEYRVGGRLCRTAGRLREYRLHSVVRCLAICAACSGQLQVGKDAVFIL